MADAGVVGGMVQGSIQGTAGILGMVIDDYQNYLNAEAQKGAQQRNQANQEITWQREDNAVQRRVADLKAAGLSPVLAAGSAAQASAPMRVEPVQIQHTDRSGAIQGMDMLSRISAGIQLQQTAAQAKLTAEQARRASVESDFLEQTLSERVQTTGLTRDTIAQALDFAKQINPEKVVSLALQNKGQELSNVNMAIKNRADELGINTIKLDQTAREIANRWQSGTSSLRGISVYLDNAIKQAMMDKYKQEVVEKTNTNSQFNWLTSTSKIQDVLNMLKTTGDIFK